MNIYDEEQRDRAELSHIKETQGLRNEIKALKQSNAELDHQLANYKAAADGTTHWCAECKMKQDRFAEMERHLENSVSKMELDTCRALNEALRQREDSMRKAMLNAGFVWRDDEFNKIEKEKE